MYIFHSYLVFLASCDPFRFLSSHLLSFSFLISSALVASSGGRVLTSLRLGGESMREKIQQALPLDPDFGRPTVTGSSVIVTTKNFNLELSVDRKHDGGFVFGSLNAFHREKTHRSVELATVCPEK